MKRTLVGKAFAYIDRIVKPDGYDARLTLQMQCVVHGDEGLST
jgi:hypothetical protein